MISQMVALFANGKRKDMIIKQNNYGAVSVVENEKYQHGVINKAGDTVVPFGKYAWISGFDHGLARVKDIFGDESINLETGKTEKAKWGIINEVGEEVLPVIYDEIWNFLNKGRNNTKVVLYGEESLFDLNTRQFAENSHYQSLRFFIDSQDDDYGTQYGAYAGSYAQDVMGYSDDVIDDAFEGDPDTYWNID